MVFRLQTAATGYGIQSKNHPDPLQTSIPW